MNRLLQVMSGERAGIAIASGIPRSMTGPFDVQTWSPTALGVVDDEFIGRLAALYRADRSLQGRFEAALQQQDLVGEEKGAAAGAKRGGVAPLLRATARILRQESGPNVAAVEFSGWDTHANQGLTGGPLDRLLGQLGDGLMAFRTEMGPAWQNTTVVVMTEFGRTARSNGTRGTDHGTGGAGFIIGPRLAHATVMADWPGLHDAALFEGARPEADARHPGGVEAAVSGTFDLTAAQADRIFPGSDGVRAVPNLMR